MSASTPIRYDERLRVPLWWWPVAAGLVALLGAEVYVGLGRLAAVATYATLGSAVTLLLLAAGSVRVSVGDGVLQAGSGRLPLGCVGAVHVLGDADRRRRMGPAADPFGWVVSRPWLRRAVECEVVDDADDTPYWLVTTRHPDELAAAVRAGRDAARQASGSRPQVSSE